MKKLNLTFLNEGNSKGKMALDPIESILHEFGQEIYNYAKSYFNYIVTPIYTKDKVTEATLYIVVPKIGYDYKVMSIAYQNSENVIVKFYSLKTLQEESENIEIKNNNWDKVYNRINRWLETPLANSIFRYLVDSVNTRDENQEEE